MCELDSRLQRVNESTNDAPLQALVLEMTPTREAERAGWLGGSDCLVLERGPIEACRVDLREKSWAKEGVF